MAQLLKPEQCLDRIKQLKKRRAFVSVDMEGLPHITSMQHMLPGKLLYDEARSIMTECTLAMTEELHESGFERIVVADSHGPKVNLIPEKMQSFVDIVRGNPRDLAMITGAKGCDAALFLGYHAKPGTPSSTFDHTISSKAIRTLKFNGEESSEFYMNAATLGEQGVPVILVAGDSSLLEDDVAKHSPWAARVPLKESLGRYASTSPSMPECLRAIREGVKTAVADLDAGNAKLLKLSPPVETEIYFTDSEFAHIGSLLPGSERIGGWGVRFTSGSMEEAYRVTLLLVYAASGVRVSVGE
jgi:D-amino peptidase